MHGEVDLGGDERVLDLLCEQAFAAEFCQRLVGNDVAGGLDDDDVEVAGAEVMSRDQPVAKLMGLSEGELAAACADADFRLHFRFVCHGVSLAKLRRAIM